MSNYLKKIIHLAIVSVLFICEGELMGMQDTISLDILSYESFMNEDAQAMSVLSTALYEKGIVGIKGIPGYQEMVERFMEKARAFSALPDEIKLAYSPDRSKNEIDLGYERGKEKFKRPDGRWVIDSLKVTYSAFVPDATPNKWPSEVDIKTPFQELGMLMAEMGKAVMKKIGLIGSRPGIDADGVTNKGRMLYYVKTSEETSDNPLWCGSHFDHGLFTALLPAFYFQQGQRVPEPAEAGLFVRTPSDGQFKKVSVDASDILLFQVGEFGQLLTNDAIRATEHKVHKAQGSIERYTMALFLCAPPETLVHSFSELTRDFRYGAQAGEPCSYQRWAHNSFNRYLVAEEDKN